MVREPVEVTAKFTPDGGIWPLQFSWQGRHYPIVSTGRRWKTEGESHVLVKIATEAVCELVFVHREGVWYLKTKPPTPRQAI